MSPHHAHRIPPMRNRPFNQQPGYSRRTANVAAIIKGFAAMMPGLTGHATTILKGQATAKLQAAWDFEVLTLKACPRIWIKVFWDDVVNQVDNANCYAIYGDTTQPPNEDFKVSLTVTMRHTAIAYRLTLRSPVCTHESAVKEEALANPKAEVVSSTECKESKHMNWITIIRGPHKSGKSHVSKCLEVVTLNSKVYEVKTVAEAVKAYQQAQADGKNPIFVCHHNFLLSGFDLSTHLGIPGNEFLVPTVIDLSRGMDA